MPSAAIKPVMLPVLKLNAIMVSVIMPIVILNSIMLNVIMLNVEIKPILLSIFYAECRKSAHFDEFLYAEHVVALFVNSALAYLGRAPESAAP